ncbi:MAG: hypothetical protein CMC18_01455 [Flavobacteriaceae bacterium]|nr:hypothetical protein [Flavobacteriaceae bacterium]
MQDIRTELDLKDLYYEELYANRTQGVIKLPKPHVIINTNTNPLKDKDYYNGMYLDYDKAKNRLKKSLRTYAYGYYKRLVEQGDETTLKTHLNQLFDELLPVDGQIRKVFDVDFRNVVIEESIELAKTKAPDIFLAEIRYLKNPFYNQFVSWEDRRSLKSFENELKQEATVKHNLDLIYTALIDWDTKCKLTLKKLSSGTGLHLSTIKRYLKNYKELKDLYNDIKNSSSKGSDIGFCYDASYTLTDSMISTKKHIPTNKELQKSLPEEKQKMIQNTSIKADEEYLIQTFEEQPTLLPEGFKIEDSMGNKMTLPYSIMKSYFLKKRSKELEKKYRLKKIGR